MDEVTPRDTIITRLRYWSVTDPDKPAFIYAVPGGHRQVYKRAELYSLSRRAATWLSTKGVSRDDVVLCLPGQSPEHLFIMLGTALLGATALHYPIVLSDGTDTINTINLGNVTALVLDQGDVTSVSILKRHIPDLAEGCDKVPTLRKVVFCNKDARESQPSFLEAITNEGEAEPAECDPDDIAVLYPTSGSTGFCKLVARTHREVLLIGQQSVAGFGLMPGETVYNPGGFGWISGYPIQYLIAGITRVLPLNTGSPIKDQTRFLWDFLCQERPTAGFFKPIVFEALLGRPDLLKEKGAWRARVMVTGSCPIKRNVADALGVLTSEVRVLYGSTEAGFNLFKSYTDVSQAKHFNCGQPYLGQKVKVVDDDLKEVKVNTKGQLLIRNDVIFSGYVNQPEETAKVMVEGGWFRPGDTATVDEKGDIFVFGRESEGIMVLGFLFYPQQVELILADIPGVIDVALVGVPDEVYLNRPCVCVVRDSDSTAAPVSADDILAACEAAFNKDILSTLEDVKHAVPKYCLFFDQFPLSRNGKLQRKVLRAQVLERLGIAE